MEYIIPTIYFTFFTLIFLILGYNFLYSHRVWGASQRLGIILPPALKRFLDFVILIAFIALLIVGFFLLLSILQVVSKF